MIELHGYKIYQTTWQGIDLTEIARSLNLMPDQVAAEHFYEEFYSRLRKNNFKFNKDWSEPKINIGKWLREYIDNIEVEMNRKVKVLSVGAGIGIVEEELIVNDYNIEIQECQIESFEYLHNKGIKAKKEWIMYDLKGITSEDYDIIFVNGVMYAFIDKIYKELLNDIFRLLNREGRLIIIDPSATIKSKLASAIRNIVYYTNKNKKRVFWGLIRTINYHVYLAKSQCFMLKSVISFNIDGKVVHNAKSFCGYVCSSAPEWVAYIYKKGEVND